MTSRKKKPPARRRPRIQAGRRARQRVTRVLAMREECTLSEASELKRELSALLADPAPVAVDAGAVERIDVAALQLLLAFTRDRRAAGLEWGWRACSPAFHAAAGRLGLVTLLGLGARPAR